MYLQVIHNPEIEFINAYKAQSTESQISLIKITTQSKTEVETYTTCLRCFFRQMNFWFFLEFRCAISASEGTSLPKIQPNKKKTDPSLWRALDRHDTYVGINHQWLEYDVFAYKVLKLWAWWWKCVLTRMKCHFDKAQAYQIGLQRSIFKWSVKWHGL